MAYCTHPYCRNMTFLDMAYLAVSTNRSSVLRQALDARRDASWTVRCRLGDAPPEAHLPPPEIV